MGGGGGGRVGARSHRHGELDRAVADDNAALKINPKLAGSLYGRGIIKQKKGGAVGADADMAAARALRPNVAEDWVKYGSSET